MRQPRFPARIDRRDFGRLLSAGFLASPALWRRKKKKGGWRPPIAFSTLGCPEWDWHTILGTASRWGYPALELRGLQGEMDLTAVEQFQGAALKRTLKDLETLAIRVVNLGTSLSFHEPGTTEANVEAAKRWIELANRLECPFIRVFGDRWVEGEERRATLARIVRGLAGVAETARGAGVTALVESHGDFTDSASLAEILEAVDSPALGLLWDTHHTVVSGKEEPSATFERLGKWVRHTHIKDSVAASDGRRYVLTGGGSVPVREIVLTLARGGYFGYYCFEWEKVWHPEIDDPEAAFPHYATVMREYLREAGVPEAFE